MRPFKMFFGIAVAAILFLYLAKIVAVAFIAAAIMSIIYAVFRRMKDFVTYDRYGEYYIKGYSAELDSRWNTGVEPLFYDNRGNRQTPVKDIQFIEAI